MSSFFSKRNCLWCSPEVLPRQQSRRPGSASLQRDSSWRCIMSWPDRNNLKFWHVITLLNANGSPAVQYPAACFLFLLTQHNVSCIPKKKCQFFQQRCLESQEMPPKKRETRWFDTPKIRNPSSNAHFQARCENGVGTSFLHTQDTGWVRQNSSALFSAAAD